VFLVGSFVELMEAKLMAKDRIWALKVLSGWARRMGMGSDGFGNSGDFGAWGVLHNWIKVEFVN
jgi:hypothetical protein